MRKLKLFSLLAVLLCAATMWGIPTQFNYCYDCYRDPAYPTVESPCNLGGFQNPFVGYKGIGEPYEVGNVPEGPWKLEFVGYYNKSNDTYGVQEQVDNIVLYSDSYYSDDDKSTFPVFRLYQRNPNTSAFEHACYGVVVAYANESNAVEHATLFISASGDYGCYLTDNVHTSGDDIDITFNADLKTGLGELTNPTPSTPATSDNVDGIESAMAALVTAGGTTDLIINRTLYKDGFFNTLCLPFSLNASELAASPLAGCQLYSLSDASYDGDNKLDLTIAEESTIEAGMPYLIKWSNGSDITSMTFTGVTVTASTGSTVTKGTGNSQVRFVGTIGRSTLPAGEENYLFLGSGDNLYYPASNDDTSMKGFRAYFIVGENSTNAPHQVPARLVIAPKMPTAVDNVQGDNVQSTKVIENGQLFIIKNGIKYNAQGKVVK